MIQYAGENQQKRRESPRLSRVGAASKVKLDLVDQLQRRAVMLGDIEHVQLILLEGSPGGQQSGNRDACLDRIFGIVLGIHALRRRAGQEIDQLHCLRDKDNDSVLGPLCKEEFDRIKKEKGINLEFKDKN